MCGTITRYVEVRKTRKRKESKLTGVCKELDKLYSASLQSPREQTSTIHTGVYIEFQKGLYL
jgi:hypothetical protein